MRNQEREKWRDRSVAAGGEARNATAILVSDASSLEEKARALKAKTKALSAQNPRTGYGRETTPLRRGRFPTGFLSDFWI